MTKPQAAAAFQVTPWVHHIGGLIERHKSLWLRLGNLETRMMADQLEAVALRRPLYVSGLARSGTTILLEMLASSTGIVSHQYKDYPFIYTPYWWHAFLNKVPQNQAPPTERSHGDGILVTPDSPEAMEEVLWMAYFDHLHDPHRSQVLDASTKTPEFERFYKDHIRKLLLVRGGAQYLSKGNYNITRLEYLLKIFPDARFIVPVRGPREHIASLVRQQANFSAGVNQNPRALQHLARVGHFEFGPHRHPINIGAGSRAEEIAALWAGGEEIRGWAKYWSDIYGFVHAALAQNPALREACLLVRFEDLCAAPAAMLTKIMAHCQIPAPQSVITSYTEKIRAPAYYHSSFSDRELTIIDEETGPTARLLGYE